MNSNYETVFEVPDDGRMPPYCIGCGTGIFRQQESKNLQQNLKETIEAIRSFSQEELSEKLRKEMHERDAEIELNRRETEIVIMARQTRRPWLEHPNPAYKTSFEECSIVAQFCNSCRAIEKRSKRLAIFVGVTAGLTIAIPVYCADAFRAANDGHMLIGLVLLALTIGTTVGFFAAAFGIWWPTHPIMLAELFPRKNVGQLYAWYYHPESTEERLARTRFVPWPSGMWLIRIQRRHVAHVLEAHGLKRSARG